MTTPLSDRGRAVKKVEDFLMSLKETGGLDLEYHILARDGQAQSNAEEWIGASSHGAPAPSARSGTAVIFVELTGSDTPLLLARNGELLHAIEHIGAKILRLEPDEHDLISFDAEGFKANRDRELKLSAEAAIQQVRSTGRPFSFPPMTSRERRMLHLALAESGLPTVSSGDGPGRFVVLYPEGSQSVGPDSPGRQDRSSDRTDAIRSNFRRR